MGFTKNQKISIAMVIVMIFGVIIPVLFDDPDVRQEAETILNQDENKGVIHNNINKVAGFVLVGKNILYQDFEHQAQLFFEADGSILPPSVCFTVAADSKILEINVEGVSVNLQLKILDGSPSRGTLCLDSPRKNMLLWVKFEKQPNNITAIADTKF
jgi:hypothetical protein